MCQTQLPRKEMLVLGLGWSLLSSFLLCGHYSPSFVGTLSPPTGNLSDQNYCPFFAELAQMIYICMELKVE